MQVFGLLFLECILLSSGNSINVSADSNPVKSVDSDSSTYQIPDGDADADTINRTESDDFFLSLSVNASNTNVSAGHGDSWTFERNQNEIERFENKLDVEMNTEGTDVIIGANTAQTNPDDSHDTLQTQMGSFKDVPDVEDISQENDYVLTRFRRDDYDFHRDYGIASFLEDVDSMFSTDDPNTLLESTHTRACSTFGSIKCFICVETTGRCDIHVSCCFDPSTRRDNNIVGENKTSKIEETGTMIAGQRNETMNSTTILTDGGSVISQSPSTTNDIGVACQSFNGGSHYLLIRGCPSDYPEEDITRKLCEEDLPVSEITVDTVTVVMDSDSGLTFFNKYCAECNGVLKVSKWEVRMNCDTYRHVMKAVTYTELIRLVETEGSTCVLDQKPGSNIPTYCYSYFHVDEKYMISSCNVTGQEKAYHYSQFVERECVDGQIGLVNRVVSQRLTFKNVFCLLCNRKLLQGEISSAADVGSKVKPAFSFLFGFHQNRHLVKPIPHDVKSCVDDEWKDPLGSCRKIVCAAGKTLEDGVCVTAFNEIRELPYRVNFWLQVTEKPDSPIPPESLKSHGETLYDEVLKNIPGCSEDIIDLTVGVLCHSIYNESQNFQDKQKNYDDCRHSEEQNQNNSRQFCDIPLAWVEILIRPNSSFSRDEFESAIFNMLNKNCCHGSELFNPQFLSGHFPAPEMIKQCSEHVNEFPCYLKRMKLFQIENSYVEWKSFLVCPHIAVTKDHVEIAILKDPNSKLLSISVKIKFNDSVTQFSDHFETSQISESLEEKDTFYICRDLLDSISRIEIQNKDSIDINVLIQYALTTLCVSISVICLFATVVTYCLFSSLRCVAGCNTLGLSSSLMVAHVLILVAGSLDYDKISSPVCLSIGVSIHYAWLSVLAWSFLCCFNMLKVFTTNMRPAYQTKQTKRREIVRNMALSVFIPASIIGGTVVTSYLLHDGSSIGYERWRCLYDDSWAMYAPLIVTTVCNAAFFVVVIVKIWRVRRLQSNMDFRKEDRKDFIVYIKLSTFTGVFWLASMLAEIFESDVLRYTAIVINGSQGIFIFCSFVWNRRVLRLYGQRYGCLDFLAQKSDRGSSLGGTRDSSVKTTKTFDTQND